MYNVFTKLHDHCGWLGLSSLTDRCSEAPQIRLQPDKLWDCTSPDISAISSSPLFSLLSRSLLFGSFWSSWSSGVAAWHDSVVQRGRAKADSPYCQVVLKTSVSVSLLLHLNKASKVSVQIFIFLNFFYLNSHCFASTRLKCLTVDILLRLISNLRVKQYSDTYWRFISLWLI